MSAKWCRFQAGDKVSYGRIEDDSVVALDGAPWGQHSVTSTRHRLSSVKLLIPTVPSTFYCVGINYREHIIASARRRGVEPVFPEKPDIGYRANNALCARIMEAIGGGGFNSNAWSANSVARSKSPAAA